MTRLRIGLFVVLCLTLGRMSFYAQQGPGTLKGTFVTISCNNSIGATSNVLVGGSPCTWSATPTLGDATTTAGTIGLGKGIAGGAIWTLASVATSNWTLTGAATAPAQGDVFTFSNATGQMASVVDVAVGSYLRSGGVGAVPVYSTVTLPNTTAVGDLWQGTTTNVVTALSSVAVGSYLRSAGVTTANVWSTLTLPNAATQGDLLTATAANVVGSVAAVATGQVLTSAGTSTVPAYSAVPVLGVATSQAGTIGLAKGVGGGAIWTLASAATSNWTMTGAATAPAQGALETYSNGTGQMSSIADVATGSVLISGGTNTAPSYSSAPSVTSLTASSLTSGRVTTASTAGLLADSANLTWTSPALSIGALSSATGQLKMVGTTSGTVTITSAAAAGTWTLTLPITAGSANQFLQTNGSGVATWAASSGLTPAYTAKTANYTAVANDLVAATSGTFTVTLPACSSNANNTIWVVNNGTGTITIGRTGSDTIGLATSQTLNPATATTQGDAMTFICDGTSNWNIV